MEMDDGLAFNVYALITDPPWRVEHEAYDSRVAVVIGGPLNEPEPVNLLQLWFKNPDEVVSLGRELMTAGMRLAAQLRTPLPDSADSGQPVEGPPLDSGPVIGGSGEER